MDSFFQVTEECYAVREPRQLIVDTKKANNAALGAEDTEFPDLLSNFSTGFGDGSKVNRHLSVLNSASHSLYNFLVRCFLAPSGYLQLKDE